MNVPTLSMYNTFIMGLYSVITNMDENHKNSILMSQVRSNEQVRIQDFGIVGKGVAKGIEISSQVKGQSPIIEECNCSIATPGSTPDEVSVLFKLRYFNFFLNYFLFKLEIEKQFIFFK